MPTASRNAVRIIGGQWRRRVLRFPDAVALRPTPDRVRETLFNWLGQSLDGRRCLDLFAGSGALGLEAASRGASSVVLVEGAAAVAAALRANLATLGALPGCAIEIAERDALQFATRYPAESPRFDVIFVDPPFRRDWWSKLRPALNRLGAHDAMVYAEAETPLDAWDDWSLTRSGKAGQVFHHLFTRNPSHAE